MASTVTPDPGPAAPFRRAASFRVSREAHTSVLWLVGEHDVETVAAVRSVLSDVATLAGDDRDVVVDLSAMTFMSSGIIEALRTAAAELTIRDRSFCIRSAPEFAVRILRLTGCEHLLVDPTRREVLLPPTEAPHRHEGAAALQRELDRFRRGGEPLTVAFIDIDGVKAAKDILGHVAADKITRQVSQALRSRLEPDDLVMRFGGDELVCSLPRTDRDAAVERLGDIATALLENGSTTLSVGFAEAASNDTIESLLGRADADLYAARAARRRATSAG